MFLAPETTLLGLGKVLMFKFYWGNFRVSLVSSGGSMGRQDGVFGHCLFSLVFALSISLHEIVVAHGIFRTENFNTIC